LVGRIVGATSRRSAHRDADLAAAPHRGVTGPRNV